MTMIGRMLLLALALLLLLPAFGAPADEQWTLWTTTAEEMRLALRWEEAEIALKQAIKVTDAFPIDDPRVVQGYLALVAFYLQQAKPAPSEALGAALIARLEREYGEKDPRVAGFLLDAAKRNRDESFDPHLLFRWALTAREKELGPDARALVPILTELASATGEEGRASLRRATALLETQYDPGDPRLIPALTRLATATRFQHPQETAALYQRIRDIEDAVYWPDDPRIADTRWQQGISSRYQERYPEDILLRRRLIDWLARTGLEIKAYYDDANTRGFLLEDYRLLGYYDEAQTELTHFGQVAAKPLGDLAMARGRYAEAETYYRQWVTRREEELAELTKKNDGGKDREYLAHSIVAEILDLADCLEAQGKAAAAVEAGARARAMLRQSDPTGNTSLYTRSIGRRFPDDPYNEYVFETLQHQAREYEQNRGLGNHYTAERYRLLGRYCRDNHRPAQAEAPFQRVVDAWEGMLGPRHRVLVHPLAELAACKAALGKREEAEALYRRAVGIAEGAYGKEDTLTVMIRKAGGTVLAPGAR